MQTDPALQPAPNSLADLLFNILTTILTPFFLNPGVDPIFGRQAAIETINAYRTNNPLDLLTIAQLIAFTFAAISSLGQSMADDLAVNQVIRLRANACALNRSAETLRKALEQRQQQAQAQQQADEQAKAAVMQEQAAMAALQELRRPAAKPINRPAQDSEQARRDIWAAAFTRTAEQCAADLANLPPEKREETAIWIKAFAETANELRNGIG